VVLEANVAYSAPSMRRFEPVRLLRAVRAAERRALLSSTLVIAVSSPLSTYLRELGGPSVHILTLPNGVNPALFDPVRADRAGVRARLGLEDRFVVGWAGVLRRWHGIEVLIDALADLPGVHLLLIGDGPDRPFIEALARERGLADRLTVTGRLPHDSMPQYLAAIDSAVAAADRTGFASPMKVVEYMAMGRAVALPRLPNLADLVDDGRTGVFFRPDDAADLARVIAELQASRPRREALGGAAREEVERRLNWRQNAAAVLDAVHGAAAAAASGR
jgi:glycosyltransferase involved in cell wall biosynthesis